MGKTVLNKQIVLSELDQLMVKGIQINDTQISFIKIKENIEEIKQKIIKVNPKVYILFIFMWWKSYNSNLKQSKDDQDFIHKVGIIEVKELHRIKEWMWKPIRVGFITHVNFRLENLLRNILFKICPITYERIRFTSILDKLYDQGLLSKRANQNYACYQL